ncbi:MAG TPA: hypothetical protein VFE42_35815 [Chloroflexota bacterium]|nr:hypothetical protein [Chloroflexota bacterium]
MNAPHDVIQHTNLVDTQRINAAEPAQTWAERLAQRRQYHPASPHNPLLGAAWAPGAIEVLWGIIDAAVAEANAALERSGLPERIGVRRTPHERYLSLDGLDGRPRYISVFANLRVLEGRVSGGATINTSESRAAIHLVPSVQSDRLRWIVVGPGTEFTAQVADDLLLSVFSDDPAASSRLLPYFSLGHC